MDISVKWQERTDLVQTQYPPKDQNKRVFLQVEDSFLQRNWIIYWNFSLHINMQAMKTTYF